MPESEIPINTMAYAVETMTVKKSGRTGHIYLDKMWIGKKVMVLRMEPLDEPAISAKTRAEAPGRMIAELSNVREKFAAAESSVKIEGKKVGKRVD